MKFISTFLLAILIFSSCKNEKTTEKDFDVVAQSFSDLQVLRYDIPGWENLTAKEKELCYYLYEAALCGRDIIYDQKSKYGLTIRKTIETIYGSYSGDKTSADWKKFEDYCGQVWFSNGNYHHYSNDKFVPECSFEYFKELISKTGDAKSFPLLNKDETLDAFAERMKPILFDLKFMPKCVNQSAGVDNVLASANNFYEGVTNAEVDAFYAKFPGGENAPSWGLNSKTMKENGVVVEKVWKSGGMYGAAIDKITYWLEKASGVAENAEQKDALDKLIKYYKSGDLKDFDDYCVAWVKDSKSKIDVVNGFIEVYLDAIGKKGSFESVVSIRDEEMTKRISTIAKEAQWFEDNSPLIPEHKKKEVKGITAKAITTIVESGDAAPSTPIGINLPNADWIRKNHGSKSVSLSNIVASYNKMSASGGFLNEFCEDAKTRDNIKANGSLSSDLHTDMHECIGHASGQINPGVGTTDVTLKTYASCLEEARADLVALYYIMDQKLIDIGVMKSMDVGKAEYDSYIMNGMLTQITRLKLGDKIEEAHMRNRALNAFWCYEKGKKDNVIEYYKKDNKTFVRVNDYKKLRVLFGELLREIQRIKSEGDYKAGKNLVENYGVNVDPVLHKEVLTRFEKLNIKPYKGFIQPKLIAEMDGEKVKNVNVEYPKNFFEQMMEYGKKYSYLPVMN